MAETKPKKPNLLPDEPTESMPPAPRQPPKTTSTPPSPTVPPKKKPTLTDPE